MRKEREKNSIINETPKASAKITKESPGGGSQSCTSGSVKLAPTFQRNLHKHCLFEK